MGTFQKAVLLFNLFLWLTVGPYLVLSLCLNVANPFSVVASGSMYPTLKQGDLIVIEGCSTPYVGDVIVFEAAKINQLDESKLIVHRIFQSESVNGTVYYETKGDNNPYPDFWSDYRGINYTHNGMITNKLLVGKVKYVIAYFGTVLMFIQTPTGTMLIVALIIIAVVGEICAQKIKLPRPSKNFEKRLKVV